MFKAKQNIYFVGIGGIGMSSLARYFNFMKYQVAGYDLTRSELTQKLEKEGIPIVYKDDISLIPESFQISENTLVVYTPAVPQSHSMLNWFTQNDFEIVKRAQLLGKLTREHKAIGVAGTHGKTSISTYLAHILYQSSLKCNAFLGGISGNYSTNLLFHEKASYTVVEADEYDRSFLQLDPSLALISSIEPDHLDIYGDFDAVKEAFQDFANKTYANNGPVIVKKDAAHLLQSNGLKLTYSAVSEADYYPEHVEYENGRYVFDLIAKDERIDRVILNMAGSYNFENVIAAAALALEAGIDKSDLQQGVATLKGVERRFQLRRNDSIIFIDDYAHHPTEIKACLESAKMAFPGKEITAVFQPHLYSRTKDFYEGFGTALNLADKVFLLPIYPARELPMEGVTSKLIADEVDQAKVELVEMNDLVDRLKDSKLELLVTMGAGDISTLVPQIEKEI
ncbi:MAG: UDP-N-acetylmuramate--L-alanine ligase [Salinivirgaceae bacterium]|nr:MAG: UDP-N-acetylmuramate--L-alanine ligase [Salinivirgaceae bacterium]